LLGGFASKVPVVKEEPQKINVRRRLDKTKNIENEVSQRPPKRHFPTRPHTALGKPQRGPYKTRALPNLVQVVF
jgi:hypothetical protein